LVADDELQTILADLVGYESLDIVAELIAHRKDVLRSSNLAQSDVSQPRRLQTRQEREEALRRQDYEHKHAALAPRSHLDKPKYPHVYAAQTSGNTLSWSGKSYSLPSGSDRFENSVSKLDVVRYYANTHKVL
jgi:antiviral helicase SLH1